jgi:membrane-associated phospholipid phosphatase
VRDRVRSLSPLRLPRGWRDAILQVGLWGMADVLYEGVRGLVVGHGDVALANAQSIVSLERTLGFFWEPAIQQSFLGHHSTLIAANWLYVNVQFTVNAVFLAFIYAYRNHIFYFVRNMFFVAMAVALIVHLAVPVAPPRMLGQLGFVDTIRQFAHINQDSGTVSLFVNPYAAVPSMHTCFALLVGVTAMRLTTNWWLRTAAVAYPALVIGVILVTANHFIFDVLTGGLTAVLAAVVAHQVMARVRPAAWGWPRVVATPTATTAAVATSLRTP